VAVDPGQTSCVVLKELVPCHSFQGKLSAILSGLNCVDGSTGWSNACRILLLMWWRLLRWSLMLFLVVARWRCGVSRLFGLSPMAIACFLWFDPLSIAGARMVE